MKQVYIEFAMRVMHWRVKAGVFCGYCQANASGWFAMHDSHLDMGAFHLETRLFFGFHFLAYNWLPFH